MKKMFYGAMANYHFGRANKYFSKNKIEKCRKHSEKALKWSL